MTDTAAALERPHTEAPRPASNPPPLLRAEAWPDPVMERLGHDPRSAYVETFWLSVLGPSTTWLLKRLAHELTAAPDGFELDCVTWSHDLGLGGHAGRNSVFMRSLERCCKFGMAQRSGAALFVRRRIPSLTRRQIDRLSPQMRQLHHAWDAPLAGDANADGTNAAATDIVVRRGRAVAAALAAVGDDATLIERQLHRWQFHPSIAWDATQWALESQDTA